MAIVPKVLADGQLPATKGTLYTVPAGRTAYVRILRIYNTSATLDEEVLIYLNVSGTSRVFLPASLESHGARDAVDDGGLTLEAGDLIEGQATDAATVDYVITGAEE